MQISPLYFIPVNTNLGKGCRDNLQHALKVKIRIISDHRLIIFRAMGPPVAISPSCSLFLQQHSSGLNAATDLGSCNTTTQGGSEREGTSRQLHFSLLSSTVQGRRVDMYRNSRHLLPLNSRSLTFVTCK